MLGVQGADGRNHYPSAYVTLMFGGPVGPEQRGIVGPADGAKPREVFMKGEPVGVE